MSHSRRSLPAAAFLLIAAAAAAGTGALAQEATNTVGPPTLKDFSLPGERTTPPATTTQTPPPASTQSPRTERPAPAPATTGPRSDPRPSPPVETRRNTAAPAAATPSAVPPAVDLPAAAPATDLPLPAPVQTPPPAAAEPFVPPPAAAAPSVEPAEETPETTDWRALGITAALLLLAVLGGLFVLRRRRTRESAEIERTREASRSELGGALYAGRREPEPRGEPAGASPAMAPPAAQPAQPAPMPGPTPEPEVAAAAAAAAAREAGRAWLEIDIKPERAAATDTGATVHYALTLRNRGSLPARNIRIDTRLLNADAEAEMAAFFDGPIHETSGSPRVEIAPEGSLSLNGQVAMAKEDMREIDVSGVRIFVPLVAINVAYDWGEGGSGRTSRSWVVGRAAPHPDGKMGAFRLDLGPRIYRSVDQREGRAVMV